MTDQRAEGELMQKDVREWPETTIPPHKYNPTKDHPYNRDPLARGCCHWAKEHPVHVG